MIYISTACVKQNSISDSIEELVDMGYYNIELSGGTTYYENYKADLIRLKNKFNLNYLVHNYYPAPKEHFVLNLASLDDETHKKSYNHAIEAINLSAELGGENIAFHAGFFIHIPLDQIGKKIEISDLYDQRKSEDRFYATWNKLKMHASSVGVNIYVENNVLSNENYVSYDYINPFMLTDKNWYYKMNKKLDFNILLDIAHLKVSSNTLNLNFEEELKTLFNETNYIHVSDNDGLSDSNEGLGDNLFNQIKTLDWTKKIVTLEVYESIDALEATYKKLTT